MDHGIVAPGTGAMAGGARRHQLRAARHLLRGRNFDEANLPVFRMHEAAFRQGIFGLDVRPMLFHQILDTDVEGAAGTLLAGLRDIDHIAVQRDAQALQVQHHHQAGRHAIFVIGGAAAPHIAVLPHAAERIHRPLFGLHAHRVRMPQNQDGPLTSVPFQSRDQVRPARFQREHLIRDALPIEDAL